MALTLQLASSQLLILVAILSLIYLVIPSFCFNPKKQWSPAVATWYGAPNGYGSDGGACGYGKIVGQPPLSSLISAGSPHIFASGKGCGSCYEVKCTENSACSKRPVKVVITDECGGCAQNHFDLSGTAFGAMAGSGLSAKLRNTGKINIKYRRVQCNHGRAIDFQVDTGSNHYYFATLVKYVDGEGDIAKVEIMEANSLAWATMQRSSGALWKLNKIGSPLQPPFSIRLTTQSGRSIVANKVISTGWTPGQTYRSSVNF